MENKKVSYSEKLDLLLDKIARHGYGYIHQQVIIDISKPELAALEIDHMLEDLTKKGYLRVTSPGMSPQYSLSPLAISAIETKQGFAMKENHDKIIYEAAIESLDLTKKSHKLNVLILIISIAALLVAIFSLKR
jgi:hypothetical protein